MRALFTNDDVKRLATGVSVACAAGLLIGAAFQPNLDEHDNSGPQMVMGDGGARKVFAASDQGLAAYQGQLPDYVVGTDWTRQQQPQEAVQQVADRGETVVYEDEPAAEPVEVAHAAWTEPPREPVSYPSMSGNRDYEANLPPAPAPPGEFDTETDAG